jgi:hypothetical protein
MTEDGQMLAINQIFEQGLELRQLENNRDRLFPKATLAVC